MNGTDEMASRIASLEAKMDLILKRMGPNWSMLGTLLAAIIAVCGMGAFAVNGPIEANRARIEQNHVEHTGRMDRMLDSLSRQMDYEAERTNTEQQRNNRVEAELGEWVMFKNLYLSGRLRLD